MAVLKSLVGETIMPDEGMTTQMRVLFDKARQTFELIKSIRESLKTPNVDHDKMQGEVKRQFAELQHIYVDLRGLETSQPEVFPIKNEMKKVEQYFVDLGTQAPGLPEDRP